ncbi:ATP-binding protein [Streptomyces endophyticus]|uniref:ATP-binding protein n=1 Tax=Streptomyces endophyticus TaxID=714166 RepID=A0ABU6FMP4_9ACTN|nr:ATP-binding protein [Streptomyces endophyticus]MEB8344067.1 ATP-binding protein [Streptomyces endophyticus]
MNREIAELPRNTNHFSVQLSPTPRAARLARLLAAEQLRAWEVGLDLDAAAHVVAELAANAVTHGRLPGRDFRLVLHVAGDTLRIEVTDTRADRLPQVAAPGGESGRGLLLVGALARRWGVREGPAPRKTVWAELDLVRPPGHGNPYAGAGGAKRQRTD